MFIGQIARNNIVIIIATIIQQKTNTNIISHISNLFNSVEHYKKARKACLYRIRNYYERSTRPYETMCKIKRKSRAKLLAD